MKRISFAVIALFLVTTTLSAGTPEETVKKYLSGSTPTWAVEAGFERVPFFSAINTATLTVGYGWNQENKKDWLATGSIWFDNSFPYLLVFMSEYHYADPVTGYVGIGLGRRVTLIQDKRVRVALGPYAIYCPFGLGETPDRETRIGAKATITLAL